MSVCPACRSCHGHSSAQMMHCLGSHRIYSILLLLHIIVYTFSFHDHSAGSLIVETIMVQGSGTWQPWHIWGKTMHFPRTFSLQSCLSTTCQTAKPFPKYLFSLIFLCVRPMAFGYAYFDSCVVVVLFLVMVHLISWTLFNESFDYLILWFRIISETKTLVLLRTFFGRG